MATPKTPAALFDFDGTIIRSDGGLPFFAELLRRYPAGLPALPRILTSLLGYAAGRVSMARVKDHLLALVAQVPSDERSRVFEQIHTARLEPLIFPGAVERIAWHREQGHRLVIVSAGLELCLEPATLQLGFDHLIGTRADLADPPRVTSRNCYGREKVRRLLAEPWFDRVDWPASWAYSDHISDLPMLTLCGHPVAASPKPALRRHARRAGWLIMDFRAARS